MNASLLLVGLDGLHHDQRWSRLCTELGFDVHFHGMVGLTSALTGLTEDPVETQLAEDARRRLADHIDVLQPFAVHALGSHPAGFLAQDGLLRASHRAPLVVHIRGGAELELYRHSPAYEARLHTLFASASGVIADNALSYLSARGYGFSDPLQLNFGTALPGNCGEDLAINRAPRSRSEPPVIVWPKASASPNTDPYPVIEAVGRLWRRGRRFRVIAFGLAWPELELHARRCFSGVPSADFVASPSTSREMFLATLQQADILLSPSMFDGISNVLLEAMAAGLTPIVSFHPAIPDELRVGGDILFADNLIVPEIEVALETALDLPDAERQRQVTRNAAWVGRHCDRRRILCDVEAFYRRLADAFASARGTDA